MKHVFLFLLFPGIVFSQSLETVIQKGHELAVVSVAMHNDSSIVATGSKDKSAKLWDLKTGREIRSFLGHDATVSALAFSPDGKTLITGSRDNTVKGWDVLSGKLHFSIASPTNSFITDIAVDPNNQFFITSGYAPIWGDTAYVYDLKTQKILHRIPVSPDKGLGYGVRLAISPDGKLLAVGEDNRIARVMETATWKQLFEFNYEDGSCGGCGTLVAFSPDSKYLYMASHNGPVKKYELSKGALLKTYESNPRDLTGFAISHDGKLVARATEKQCIVWDAETGTPIDSIEAEAKSDFHEIAFTRNNKQLMITSDNNTAFAWNFTTHKKEIVLTGILNERDQGGLMYDANFVWQSAIARYVRFKNQLMLSKDGKQLIKGKFGAKVKRWDIASGQTMMEYVGHKKAVLCYALSTDGKRMLTGGGDGKVVLWDVERGDSLRVFHPHREPIFDIQFSHDETMFACSSWDATLRIYNLTTGKSMHYIDFKNNSVYALRFHPNDLYVFTAQLDFSLNMIELDTRTSVRSFVGHTDVISSIQISPDQQQLLSTGWDGSVRLWSIATGLMMRKFKDHQGAVHIGIFSRDGKTIYTAGADRAIRTWDVATGKLMRIFEGHNAEVTSLLLSPDEKMLISHSVDGSTKFWDLNTNNEFFEHIHLGERDWMIKTTEGYFSGTQDARKHIHFVDGIKTYSADQFFQEFYRPDLLPKLFQNRGSASFQNMQGKLQSSPPPGVKIATTEGDTPAQVIVHVKITDEGGGISSLRLLHNGKVVPVDKASLQLPSGKGKSTIYKHTLNLVGGTNTFTAVAVNKGNVESDAAEVELFSEIAVKNNVCYIVAVGINQYKNPRMNLNYAKPDAESFTEIVKQSSSSLFGNIELITLFDELASRTNILQTLDELSKKVNPEDVFIFYYAGHGSMVDNNFYFIPSESLRLYDGASLRKDALDASLLQEKFKSIKALKQLIIMDACQSGGSVELLANRGAAEEKAIAQLSRSAGIHVMAAAGSEQFAAEFTELGHGIFTYVLIEALRGAADGAPKDGKITIYELKSYIDDQVPELTRKMKGKPQYPYTFSRGQDFPIILGND